MKIKLFLLLLIFSVGKSYCQQTTVTKISFHPVLGALPFVLEYKSYHLNTSDSIKFETLKFYVSNVQLLSNGNVVYTEANSFHLIDASIESSFLFSLTHDSKIIFNELKFDLGIDSITNVMGAMGGDLDPTKGMYWTWQSGYINFKLEGTSNACPARKNEFEFHLGGYQSPFKALQSIQLKVNLNDAVEIYLDLKKYFDTIDLTKQNQVMSPNKEAVELSSVLAKCFYAK